MPTDTDVDPTQARTPAARVAAGRRTPVAVAADQPFQHIGRNVNKIVEQIQKGYYSFRPNETWAPNVNLYETDDLYLVCVDLAGVDKESIVPEVQDSRLTLRGTRGVPAYDDHEPNPVDRGKLRVHVMEIDHGAFYREVEIPDQVDQARIAAHYRNGMLWIELPKR